MQCVLFELIEATPTQKKEPIPRPSRAAENEADTLAPEQTLFGPIETKAQSRNRAKRIVRLLGIIEDAPLAIRCCEHDIQMLEYFIKRSEQVLLDPNDRDGLLRLVGDLQERLTEEECQEMLENEAIWKLVSIWLDRQLERPGVRCGPASKRGRLSATASRSTKPGHGGRHGGR